MKKRISLLLAIILCMSLSACADQSAKTTPPSGSTVPSSTPSSGDVSQIPSLPSAPESESTPISLPDSASASSESKTIIEKMIQKYKTPSMNGPTWSDAKPNGIDLYYADGTITHVPISSSGPGIHQTHTISLRNDAVVIAYSPENSTNTVSVISTTDKGESWQSTNLNIENAEKYSHYYLSFQNVEEGILILHNEENSNCLIYTTEDTGKTWISAASLANLDVIYAVSAESLYCISGENMSYPVVYKSVDGLNWSEKSLYLDENEYTKGYCTYAAFSDNIGLAVVVASNANEDTAWLYFISEDYGDNWSLYKTGP